jgi:pyridine nucleotide-disulfide oxidoreductase family protein
MKRLLLVGGGHAHLGVLKSFIERPLAGVEVTLVTPYPRQVYSGMVPGWIAGHYTFDQIGLALAPLAQRAGATLVAGHVTRLDLGRRSAQVMALQKEAAFFELPFDVVSIDIGPVVDSQAIAGSQEHAIPLRPLEQFITQWPRVHVQMMANAIDGGETSTLSVIGGGAGGVEVALAVAWRAHIAQVPLRVQLIAGQAGVMPNAPASVRARVLQALPARGVRVIDDDAVAFERGTVELAQGGEVASEASLLVTGAAAAEWPGASGLAVDGRGFIGINDCLQSLSHPFVFAAGDCASLIDHPRAKSGVYAVRAGPPLAENLRRALAGTALKRWQPQRRALYLFSTGPRHAIASWGGLSVEGNWVWRWKDRIDRRFVASFG